MEVPLEPQRVQLNKTSLSANEQPKRVHAGGDYND